MAEMFIMAIDQGTTSSRAIIFNHAGQIVSSGQRLGHVLADENQFGTAECPVLESIGERPTRDVLHHKAGPAGSFDDLLHRYHIWVALQPQQRL